MTGAQGFYDGTKLSMNAEVTRFKWMTFAKGAYGRERMTLNPLPSLITQTDTIVSPPYMSRNYSLIYSGRDKVSACTANHHDSA